MVFFQRKHRYIHRLQATNALKLASYTASTCDGNIRRLKSTNLAVKFDPRIKFSPVTGWTCREAGSAIRPQKLWVKILYHLLLHKTLVPNLKRYEKKYCAVGIFIFTQCSVVLTISNNLTWPLFGLNVPISVRNTKWRPHTAFQGILQTYGQNRGASNNWTRNCYTFLLAPTESLSRDQLTRLRKWPASSEIVADWDTK